MIRWFRLLYALISSRFKSRLTIHDLSVLKFSVWLTDVDANIMNHAAMMTVFEVGRIDFIQRVGFLSLLRKKKWYFASGSISVQFLRPLKVFQKAELSTRLLYVSDEDMYTEQKITRAGKDIAICITKSRAKQGKTTIHTDEILACLKETKKPVLGKERIEQYEKSNARFRET